MLNLLRCEFAKLRRKPLFFAAAAVSALIPLGCALFLPDFQEFTSGAEAVDGMMSTLFQMSAYLLLMPALVVLASNLLTSNNYSFSLNAIPMQAGEVVTDVYFDFGKVPVGFQSIAGPTLSVIVNGNAVKEYLIGEN